MRIAVTYDNGQIWQHFGKTEFFKFYNVEEGSITKAEGLSHDRTAGGIWH